MRAMLELGRRADGLPLLLPENHLRTHAAIFGMTGSGKTGLGIVLLEEALINGIPVLAFDVKGDITNLALKRSLGGRAARLADKEVLIITPGSTAGLPLSISGLLSMPGTLTWERHEEILLEKINTISEAILGLVYKGRKDMEREKAFIAAIIEHAWRQGEPLDLERLVSYILDPPFHRIGVLSLENFYPLRERRRLAVALNKLLSLPSFKLWRRGIAPDISSLLWGSLGRPRAVVIYMAHLDERQRMFVVTLMLQQVYGWMFEVGSSSSLRALVFFDEIYGYLPPYPKNPPSKHLLMLLFKQARAFGVSMVISTQNPVDVDYKVLSNAGLWFVGKLKTANDRRRLLEGLSQENAFYDKARLEAEITGLQSREFLLINSLDREVVRFRTRDAYSELRGPLTLEEIKSLTGSREPPQLVLEESSTPPMIPDELPTYFLPDKAGCGRGIYRPLIYVKLYAKAYNKKLKIERTVSTARFIIPQPLVKIQGLRESAYCIRAEELDVSSLSSKWARGFSFDRLPEEYMRRGIYRKLERKVKILLSSTGRGLVELYIHRGTGLVSNVGESLEEFQARVRSELGRKAELEKSRITAEYDARISALAGRIAEVERSIVDVQRRLLELDGIKARLSALFGGDRERAKAELRLTLLNLRETLAELKGEVESLRVEKEERIAQVNTAVEGEARNVEIIPLTLKKNSINIELFLVWVPLVEEEGTLYNCFTGGSCGGEGEKEGL